jgi:alpha-tubulin suppressor-like RCC1 family protein
MCALDSDGRAYCWGLNVRGALGDGTTTDSDVPVAVDTPVTFTQIAAGEDSSCALDPSGTVWCWGGNRFGQLGNGTFTGSDVPVKADGPALAALAGSVSFAYFCGLDTAGHAWCWGAPQAEPEHSATPEPVDTSGVLAGKTLTQITAGSAACARDTAGAAYCWGFNFFGELGGGFTGEPSGPVAVDTSGRLAGKALRSVAAGAFWTCAADAQGTGYCWGRDRDSQLGDRRLRAPQSDVPVLVAPSPPGGVTAAHGDGSAVLSWTAPALNAGTVTGYTATASPGGASCFTTGTGCTVSGLANGTHYRVTVTAHSAAGNSRPSRAAGVTPRIPGR